MKDGNKVVMPPRFRDSRGQGVGRMLCFRVATDSELEEADFATSDDEADSSQSRLMAAGTLGMTRKPSFRSVQHQILSGGGRRQGRSSLSACSFSRKKMRVYSMGERRGSARVYDTCDFWAWSWDDSKDRLSGETGAGRECLKRGSGEAPGKCSSGLEICALSDGLRLPRPKVEAGLATVAEEDEAESAVDGSPGRNLMRSKSFPRPLDVRVGFRDSGMGGRAGTGGASVALAFCRRLDPLDALPGLLREREVVPALSSLALSSLSRSY